MVAVPNLSNRTPSQAIADLNAVGLQAGTSTSSNTSNSSIGNLVFSQSVSAGTLVDYDSVINYNYYVYVSSGGGGGTTTIYFAYCSGSNVSQGTSSTSGSVSDACATLKTQQGNPTGWTCGTVPISNINCTPTPPPSTTLYYAYCDGETVASGTSSTTGSVTDACLALKTSFGNPSNWICNSSAVTNPTCAITPPPPAPVITYGDYETNGTSPSTIPESCSGYNLIVGPYTQNWKRKVLSDGVWTGSYDYPAGTYVAAVNAGQVNGYCGYPPPTPVTCVTSQINYSGWSTCSGSPATEFRTYYNYTECSDGSSTTQEVTETRDCCRTVSTTVSSTYGACGVVNCGEKCKTTSTTVLCGSVSTTTTTDGPCVSCIGGTPCA
jgi:hypothetical protein